MSNYDPNRPAPGQGGQPSQIFCSNCNGGNPPDAQNCIWCGRPLTPATAPAQRAPDQDPTLVMPPPAGPPPSYTGASAPTQQYSPPAPGQEPVSQPPADYSQPQYGQSQYGQPQYGQPQVPPQQYGAAQPQYGQPQYAQPAGAQVNVQRKRSPWPWIIGGLLVLCLLVAIPVGLYFGGIATFINSAGQELSRQATATAQAQSLLFEATPTEEVLEEPTEEIVEEPTAEVIETPTEEVLEEPTTEIPVELPTEIPTPVLDLSPEEQDYVFQWTDWMQRYGTAFTEFSLLAAAPNVEDETWNTNLNTQLDEIEAVSQEILDYQATPELFTPVHDRLTEAATQYNEAVGFYRTGFSDQDEAALNEGNVRLQEGTTALQEAVTEMENLANQ